MKNRKYTCLAVAIAALFTASQSTFAGQEFTLHTEVQPQEDLFVAGEFNLDTFAAYTVADDGHFDDAWGGGVGLTYFVTRYIGIGVEGFLVDGEGSPHRRDRSDTDDTVGAVNGSLILRLPMDELRLAPYAFGGGGVFINDDGDTLGQGHLGGGVEYRVTRNVGVFVDGRHVWREDADNYGLFRGGVRFAF